MTDEEVTATVLDRLRARHHIEDMSDDGTLTRWVSRGFPGATPEPPLPSSWTGSRIVDRVWERVDTPDSAYVTIDPETYDYVGALFDGTRWWESRHQHRHEAIAAVDELRARVGGK